MNQLPLILDGVLALLLLLFVISGIRQGFVLSLCSFLAVFVALFGAVMITKYTAPLVTDFAAPHFLPSIVEKVEDTSPEISSRGPTAEALPPLLEHLGLPESWMDMVVRVYQGDQEETRPPFTSPSQMIAKSILEIAVAAGLFILSFILLLILWKIVSKALDLVTKLPVLNFCNRLLGALLGLLKGLLLLFILRWLFCDFLGLVPAGLIEETYLFQFLSFAFLWLSQFLRQSLGWQLPI